jgi:hypothetical protein
MKREYWKVPEFASHFSVADKTDWADPYAFHSAKWTGSQKRDSPQREPLRQHHFYPQGWRHPGFDKR